MPKKPTVHFILKTPKSKDSLIMTRCRYYGTDIYVSTKECVSVDKWDKKAERCIVAEHMRQTDREKRNHRRINKLLDSIRLCFINIVDGIDACDEILEDKQKCIDSIKSSLEWCVHDGYSPFDPIAIKEAELLKNAVPTVFLRRV